MGYISFWSTLMMSTDRGKQNTIQKHGALLVISKGVCLEVHAEKTKHTPMSCQQNTEKNHNKMTANEPYKNVAKVQYLGDPKGKLSLYML
jgi:predicted RNA-binding protein with PIN domain